jgi:uncharacterized protein DUF4389
VPYPVTFEMDYVEGRSRVTTAFRLLLAIPHIVVWYFYSLAALVVVVVAWFALVFTGRYPQGMYDFVAGWLRYYTYVYGYIFLATDEYPPFSGDPDARYPVRLNIAPPLDGYSRAKAGFRFILGIPVAIIISVMQIVYQLGAFLAWFAIVILGRQPRGLQDMIGLGLSYQQRGTAYLALLTETWPPFTDEQPAQVEPARAFGAIPAAPPAAGVATSAHAPDAGTERVAPTEEQTPAPDPFGRSDEEERPRGPFSGQ